MGRSVSAEGLRPARRSTTTLAANSRGRRSIVRCPGPVRGSSPTAISKERPRVGAPFSIREEVENLEQKKALLEWQVEEAARTKEALELALSEKQNCRAANRQKFADLNARIEELENRSVIGLDGVENNTYLHRAGESQQQHLQDTQKHVEAFPQALQTSSCKILPALNDQLREENLQLQKEIQQSRDMLAQYKELLPGIQQLVEDLCPSSTGSTTPTRIDSNQPEENSIISHGNTCSPTFMADRSVENWDVIEGDRQLGLQAKGTVNGSTDNMVSTCKQSGFPFAPGSHRSVSPLVTRSQRSVSPLAIGVHCRQSTSNPKFLRASPVAWQNERTRSAALPRTNGALLQLQYKQPNFLMHVRHPQIYQTRVL